MARLYAATGDGIARVDEAGEAWTVELSLSGSGAQCLAVDPVDPDTVFAGLREGGVRRSVDGGRSWQDRGLPEPGVFSLAVSAANGVAYAGTEPSRLFRSDDQGESWTELEALLELPSRPNWSPAAAMDLARALDRAEPARRRAASGRDRARRGDALDRRGRSRQDDSTALLARASGLP